MSTRINSSNQPDLESSLQRIYERRFDWLNEYRLKVWDVLFRDFFLPMLPKDGNILDLGCGYGQFINQVSGGKRYAMDLNPTAGTYLKDGVTFLHQDCSKPWEIPENHLDVVFTSNFFEHLLSVDQLHDCMDQVYTHLKPGGLIIAMGPNVRVLHGHYWDFIDHSLALTDLSMRELFELHGLTVERCHARFLPYRMTNHQPPLWTVSLYLKSTIFWKIFGKQFLLVGRKAAT